jgi:Family of unknown function (DUF5977)
MANTGRIRYEEKDMNPQSPTFGQTRYSAWETNTDACPIAQIYYSDAVSGYTTKNNCSPGQTGSSVYYTVPARYASSPISKDEAQALAQSYYENTRQGYANANGTCSGLPDTVRLDQFSFNKTTRAVTAQAVRSNSTGELRVRYSYTIYYSNGSAPETLTNTIIIPDGQTSAEKITYPVENATIVTRIGDAKILSTVPDTYQIQN